MFESIGSRQRAPDDRRLIIFSRGRDLSRSANAVSAGNRNFSLPFLFFYLAPSFGGDPLRIYEKALRFLKLRVFQTADGEDLVIRACTVFD